MDLSTISISKPLTSGPNGDFLEADLMRQSKGTMKVSLDLLPSGCVLMVYNELSTAFVRFKRGPAKEESGDTSISCLHEYAGVVEKPCQDSSAVVKKPKNSCDCVWILPFKRKSGGGVNIQTLKFHVDVHYPKPMADRKKHAVSAGQKSLTSFMTKKTAEPAVTTIVMEIALPDAPLIPSFPLVQGLRDGSTSMLLSESVYQDTTMPLCGGVHYSDVSLPLNVSFYEFVPLGSVLCHVN